VPDEKGLNNLVLDALLFPTPFLFHL